MAMYDATVAIGVIFLFQAVNLWKRGHNGGNIRGSNRAESAEAAGAVERRDAPELAALGCAECVSTNGARDSGAMESAFGLIALCDRRGVDIFGPITEFPVCSVNFTVEHVRRSTGSITVVAEAVVQGQSALVDPVQWTVGG
jgi:hypothetical protein